MSNTLTSKKKDLQEFADVYTKVSDDGDNSKLIYGFALGVRATAVSATQKDGAEKKEDKSDAK